MLTAPVHRSRLHPYRRFLLRRVSATPTHSPPPLLHRERKDACSHWMASRTNQVSPCGTCWPPQWRLRSACAASAACVGTHARRRRLRPMAAWYGPAGATGALYNAMSFTQGLHFGARSPIQRAGGPAARGRRGRGQPPSTAPWFVRVSLACPPSTREPPRGSHPAKIGGHRGFVEWQPVSLHLAWSELSRERQPPIPATNMHAFLLSALCSC